MVRRNVWIYIEECLLGWDNLATMPIIFDSGSFAGSSYWLLPLQSASRAIHRQWITDSSSHGHDHGRVHLMSTHLQMTTSAWCFPPSDIRFKNHTAAIARHSAAVFFWICFAHFKIQRGPTLLQPWSSLAMRWASSCPWILQWCFSALVALGSHTKTVFQGCRATLLRPGFTTRMLTKCVLPEIVVWGKCYRKLLRRTLAKN